MSQLHCTFAVQYSFVAHLQVLVKHSPQSCMSTALVEQILLLCLSERMCVLVYYLPHFFFVRMWAKTCQLSVGLYSSLHKHGPLC